MQTNLSDQIYNLYKNLIWRDRAIMKSRFAFMPLEIINDLLPSKGKILDIGCGHGAISNYLALKSENRELVGIDLSKERIKIAMSSTGNNRNVSFYHGDLFDLKNVNCDGILLCEILNFVPFDKQKQLIAYCYKCLNKGGILVVKDLTKDKRIKYIIFFTVEFIVIWTLKITKLFLSILSKKIAEKYDEYYSLYFGKRSKQNKPYLMPKNMFELILTEEGFSIEKIPFKNKSFLPQIMYRCKK